MAVVKGLYLQAKSEFDKAGIDDPAFNSMCLIEKVFGVDKTRLMSEVIAAEDDKAVEFIKLVGRRLTGEPLQYLLGEWEFYGYKMKVGRGVLIPRDDTEVLLRDCLGFLKGRKNARIIDLCSGSGALAIAIAKEYGGEVYAVEKSAEALPYLCENIAINKADVNVIADDIMNCADEFGDGFFDLILSNPPYIISSEIDGLQKEISFEPKMALDGGADGYDFYRAITDIWSDKLGSGGMLAYELGEGQFDTVRTMMENKGFSDISGSLDLGGIKRSIHGIIVR